MRNDILVGQNDIRGAEEDFDMKIFVLLGFLVLFLVGCSGDGDDRLVDYDYDGEVQIIIEPIIEENEPVELVSDYGQMFATLYRHNISNGLYLLVQGYYAELANAGGDEVIFSHIEHRGLYMVSIEDIPNAQEVAGQIFEYACSLNFDNRLHHGLSTDPTLLFKITYDGVAHNEMPHIIATSIEVVGLVGRPFDWIQPLEVAGFDREYDDFLVDWRSWQHTLSDFRSYLWSHIEDSYYTFAWIYIPEMGSESYRPIERDYPHFWAGFRMWDEDYIIVYIPNSVDNAQQKMLEYLDEILVSSALPHMIMSYIRFAPFDFSSRELEAKRIELLEMGFCYTSVSINDSNRISVHPWPHVEFEGQLADEVDGHPMLEVF